MTSLPVADDDVFERYRAVLTRVDGDLAHLRELRASGAAGGDAERALRARGEHEVRLAHSARDPLADSVDEDEAEAC